MRKNDIIEIAIDDISIEGAGIGRFDGQIVFVQKALPGERVSVKIIKVKKNYAIGLMRELLESSSEREAPFCDVFDRCGGCTLQHLSYEAQTQFKANHIQQCIKRLGGIDIGTPKIIAADNTRDYRNKASFPIAEQGGKVQSGFYAKRSHNVIPSDCPIQKDRINEVKNVVVAWANESAIVAYNEKTSMGTLRHIIVRESLNGQIMVGIVSTRSIVDDKLIDALTKIEGVASIVQNINNQNTNAILGDTNITFYGEDYITEQYDDLSFRVALPSFLQVNHEQTEKLYATALEFADIAKDDVVFDLFCGIGTISLLAAKRAAKVVGIEYAQIAVDNAIANAELNGIENTQFLAGDAGARLDIAVKLFGKPDIVIIDPPRKGCDATLIDKICELQPKKVVYVSCNPATLARDIALFCEHGYVLDKIVGVDMFAHTTHVESCALLVR